MRVMFLISALLLSVHRVSAEDASVLRGLELQERLKAKSACCADNACRPIKPEHMSVGSDGVTHFDDMPATFQFSRAMPSPDDLVWRALWHDTIICLFVPKEIK